MGEIGLPGPEVTVIVYTCYILIRIRLFFSSRSYLLHLAPVDYLDENNLLTTVYCPIYTLCLTIYVF